MDVISREECCGCGSCALICPVSCIEMKEDFEGFLYPVINDDLCLECNECRRHCPVVNVRK